MKMGYRIDKCLSNNDKIDSKSILYRKAFLLNAILLVMLVTCFMFVFVNIIIFKVYGPAVVNALVVLLSLLNLLYFKKTDNYKPVSYASVGILITFLIVFFHISQNQHYAFYWLAILPPIIYFLLEPKAAVIVLSLFGGYLLYFFISNQPAWSPAEFDGKSIFNIFGPTLCLVLMIAYSEKCRKEVLNELEKLNLQLDANQKELRLILDSAAEAIFGIDLNGNCTFCNKSCIKMLGYNDQADLLGKNIHMLIHHTGKEGAPLSEHDCGILQSFFKGEGAHVDDEVFWRADGTSFDVEYYSYPQVKNGEIIGAVVTFLDISERKQKEAEIKYLSCYDTLTGLYNRRCFDETRTEMDNPENLPLSVIFADINGLKMTNDIFGHTAGDELIRKSSEILQNACRKNDIIARIGGDEFCILLPKTGRAEAGKVLDRILRGFADARVEAIKCSISLGLDTKITPEQSLDEVLSNAENAMYRDKTMNRQSINYDIINTIIETLHSRSAAEKQHSMAVSELCGKVGAALGLSEPEINTLKRAAYLHDIGKIILDKSILTKEALTEEEIEKMRQHSVVGYRILNLFDDTLDLAEYVYGHHESWDGTGYPRRLKDEQIPLLSRIIAIVESYDRALNNSRIPVEKRKQAAVEVVKNGAGKRFDPNIAEVFSEMVQKSGEAV